MLHKLEKTADLSVRNFADLRFRIFADFTSTILVLFCKYLNFANMCPPNFISNQFFWKNTEKMELCMTPPLLISFQKFEFFKYVLL